MLTFHSVANVISKVSKILLYIVAALGVIGTVTTRHNTQNYDQLQPELYAPDSIETVLYSEKYEQIYVCYNQATYVNVYDLKGNFQWAVSIPYYNAVNFELRDDTLIIYDYDAYVYNAKNGKFIETADSDELGLTYENTPCDENKVYFDALDVYIYNSENEAELIVQRPLWYILFLTPLCIVAACILGVLGFFFENMKSYCTKQSSPIDNDSMNPKSQKILKYLRVTSIINICYAIINLLIGFTYPISMALILPLALHFIIAGIVLFNWIDSLKLSAVESYILNRWKFFYFASMIIAVISVIITALSTET